MVVGGIESENWVLVTVMALIYFQRRGDVECNPAAENAAVIMAQRLEHAHVRGKVLQKQNFCCRGPQADMKKDMYKKWYAHCNFCLSNIHLNSK